MLNTVGPILVLVLCAAIAAVVLVDIFRPDLTKPTADGGGGGFGGDGGGGCGDGGGCH